MDKHAQRIDIFNSTLELISQGWYLASDGSKVELPPVGEVMAAAKMYSMPFVTIRSELVFPSGYAFEPTEVRVENKDCVMAAKALIGAGGMMLQQETDITLDKMRTILRIGLANEHDSLVLSAFGCGAFANSPAHIAKLFHQVIEEDEFIDCYRLIDFAILDGYRTGLLHNPEGNYLPFLREFA